MPGSGDVFATSRKKLQTMNLDADWPDLTKRLLLVARAAVAKYAPPDRRRFERVSQAYVLRAVQPFFAEHSQNGAATLFQSVAAIVVPLVGHDGPEVHR